MRREKAIRRSGLDGEHVAARERIRGAYVAMANFRRWINSVRTLLCKNRVRSAAAGGPIMATNDLQVQIAYDQPLSRLL